MQGLHNKARESSGKVEIHLRNRTITVSNLPKPRRLHSLSRRLRVSRDERLEIPRSPLESYVPRSGGVTLIRPEEEEEEEKTTHKRVITPPPHLFLQRKRQNFEPLSDDEEDESAAHKFDGVEVTPGVFFGGEGCARDASGRARLNVKYVLSLATEFEAELQDESSASDGIQNHKCIRLENAADADLLGSLDACFAFIKEAHAHKSNVVVHSLEGRSRSMSIAVAYLMVNQKLTLKEAYRRVHDLSPGIGINRGFWRQLHALDVLIHGIASIPEEELPGAIIFEKEALERIVAEYARSHRPG